jgi:hypothetical protein
MIAPWVSTDELRAKMQGAEAWEERYGWDEEDEEDSLGPYAGFVEPLTALFDRAEAAFDYADVTLARACPSDGIWTQPRDAQLSPLFHTHLLATQHPQRTHWFTPRLSPRPAPVLCSPYCAAFIRWKWVVLPAP